MIKTVTEYLLSVDKNREYSFHMILKTFNNRTANAGGFVYNRV